jgi:hypothetical protein
MAMSSRPHRPPENMLDTPNAPHTPRPGWAVFAGFMSVLTCPAQQRGATAAGRLHHPVFGLKDDLVSISVVKSSWASCHFTGVVMIMADVRITSRNSALESRPSGLASVTFCHRRLPTPST